MKTIAELRRLHEAAQSSVYSPAEAALWKTTGPTKEWSAWMAAAVNSAPDLLTRAELLDECAKVLRYIHEYVSNGYENLIDGQRVRALLKRVEEVTRG